MKKRIAMFLAAAMVVICVQADTWTDPDTGYTWTYRINGDSAEIGNGGSGSKAVDPDPFGAVTIPPTLGGKPVTRIGMGAFYCCSNLTSVTIPASVTSIEKSLFVDGSANYTEVGAFTHCLNLKEFIVDSGNQYYKSDQGLILSKDGRTLVYGISGNVVVPDGVTHIGKGAFAGSGLTSVTIPSSVTSIGEGAFLNCDSMASVTIPNSVTNIGLTAFGSCDGLTSMVIPQCACASSAAWELLFGTGYNVDMAGRYTLVGNSENIGNIKNIVIQDGVKSIGENVFSRCSGLMSVTIPGSVTSIGAGAFKDCSELTSVVFKGNAPDIGEEVFYGVGAGCTIYVHENSTGWGVDIPGMWHGDIPIRYNNDNDESGVNVDTSGAGTGSGVTPGGVVAETVFAKAQTVDGALYRGDALVGTVQVKVGKVNKKGVVKVSATATLIVKGAAKKITAKAVNVTLDVTGRVPPVTIAFKAPIGEMTFEMEADGTFTLKNATYLMAEAKIGGALKGGSRGTFHLDAFHFAVKGKLQDELIPYEEPFSVNGKSWTFAKAASVKWAKDKKTEQYDLVVDTSKGKTNLSGLKLTYALKTGQFKGSFKAYALETANGKTKQVKYKVAVIGFVVDGVGHGEASCKEPSGGPWAVTVE